MSSKASLSQKHIAVHEAVTQVNLKNQLEQDVRAGFALSPKELPPKYFYDADGSTIFELITELPEYYVTRAEAQAIRRLLKDEGQLIRYSRLSEIGSGSSLKTRLLLEALHDANPPGIITYQPIDISGNAISEAARSLVKDYDWLKVAGVVGDFLGNDLAKLHIQKQPQLLIFLGNTLGNLSQAQRTDFLKKVANNLGEDDSFLLGIDLQKDPDIIYAAYNDSQGVTARFNKNVIQVLRNQLGANFDVNDFEHDAPYVKELGRVEMRLIAKSDLEVHFDTSDLPDYQIKCGEYILTELSYKFTRKMIEQELRNAGMSLLRWHTDEQGLVGLALAKIQT